MGPHRAAVALSCAAACLASLAPTGAAAQGAPYNKSELIRLIGSQTVSRRDLAAQVNLRCVSFAPTARDLRDLRTAGADSAILQSVANCIVPGAVVRLELPHAVRAVAGAQVTLDARLVRGNVPLPGVRLVVRGAREVQGGPAADPSAATTGTGIARFQFPAGTQAGTHQLRVLSATGSPGVQAFVDLEVAPGPATRAEVNPTDVVFVQSAGPPVPVQVEVQDAYGNRLAGTPVELRGRGGEPIPGMRVVLTDGRGMATLEVPSAAVARAPVSVVSRGRRLSSLSVRSRSLVLSPEGTVWVRHADQRGIVGAELPLPLAFSVRDHLRQPVAGFQVDFTAANATVEPARAVTDLRGEVMVRVKLGERAGPAVVTALAGSFRREATLYAAPGPARELIVQLRDAPFSGTLGLTTRDPVTLSVAARDAYGNAVLAGAVDVSADGDAVRAGTGAQYGSPGTVVIQGQKSGRAVVTIGAAGIATRVPVEVDLPPVGWWLWGMRAGGAALSYSFHDFPNASGGGGFRGELMVGRSLSPATRLEVALGGGAIAATATGGDVTVLLWQGLLRTEFALRREGRVVPVLALAGGGFRIKPSEPGSELYHTSLFFSGGAGLDVALRGNAVWETRLSAQRLIEATSDQSNGSVGWLTVLEMGVRFAP